MMNIQFRKQDYAKICLEINIGKYQIVYNENWEFWNYFKEVRFDCVVWFIARWRIIKAIDNKAEEFKYARSKSNPKTVVGIGEWMIK